MTTREEIIAAVRKLGERLGRAPSQAEFRRENEISWHQIYKHFRGMRAAVRAAGFEPGPRGGPLDENVLVLDWARVVRELGRLPSRAEYVERGKHHAGTLHARLGWSQMAHRFVLLVREFHLESEWRDVVEMVCGKFPLLARVATGRWQLANSKPGFTAEVAKDAEEGGLTADPRQAGTGLRGWPLIELERGNRESSACRDRSTRMEHQRTQAGAPVPHGMRLGKLVAAALAVELLMAWATCVASPMQDESASCVQVETCEPSQGRRVLYGAPLEVAAMAHAPTNELGVVFLFGALAAGMGFRVERLQAAFPDCEAKREIVPGKWERVRIEFEFESRNFREHRHDPEGCDVIVCWRHNWTECPERIEVVELSRVVG